MRNPKSRRCMAHHHISRLASKRIVASGTFVVNTPVDLAGQCLAGNAPLSVWVPPKRANADVAENPHPNRDNALVQGTGVSRALPDMRDPSVWIRNKNHKQIDRVTVRLFQQHFLDRATKKILSLPPLRREAVNYDVNMSYEDAHAYNQVLQEARALKVRIERARGRGPDHQKNMTQLIAKFAYMQQAVVSPLLAAHGAAAFDERTVAGRSLYARASMAPSGAFFALRDELNALRMRGHKNMVIACQHTTPLEIVKRWIEREHPEFGTCFEYKGGMSQKKRIEAKKGFLRSARSLMFLSIGAGGVGLHLVPKPEALLFWGSMPYSPAHVEQVWNRIHRIGQHAPITGQVTVVHMVPYGSVDYGIGTVHGDKQTLINLVQENDATGFGGDADDQWRKGCRIVDACLPLDDTGSFGTMPRCMIDPRTRAAIPGTTFTVLPGVVTRGREPPTVDPAADAAADGSGAAETTPTVASVTPPHTTERA